MFGPLQKDQDEDVSKYNQLPVVSATDRSMVAILIMFSFCVVLWFLYYRVWFGLIFVLRPFDTF